MMPRPLIAALVAGLVLGEMSAAVAAAETKSVAAHHGAAEAIIAVGERSVSVPEFEQALRLSMRQKFYHGKVPPGELNALQKTVAEEMVSRILLLDEAARRGIQPDEEMVKQTVSRYDAQYKGNPNYDKNRERMLEGVVGRLKEQDQLSRLEKMVREVPVPTADEARQFYLANQNLFTEPEKVRVSVILLAVDPSSATPVWDKAHEEAVAIHARLKGGADFAELARLHSSDRSAEKGGDMGYLHRGMLTPLVEEQLDKAKPGDILAPIRILEGEAIFRFDDRKKSELRPFEGVQQRATDLLRRERGDVAWKELAEGLRSAASVRIDEARFAEIAARLKID